MQRSREASDAALTPAQPRAQPAGSVASPKRAGGAGPSGWPVRWSLGRRRDLRGSGTSTAAQPASLSAARSSELVRLARTVEVRAHARAGRVPHAVGAQGASRAGRARKPPLGGSCAPSPPRLLTRCRPRSTAPADPVPRPACCTGASRARRPRRPRGSAQRHTMTPGRATLLPPPQGGDLEQGLAAPPLWRLGRSARGSAAPPGPRVLRKGCVLPPTYILERSRAAQPARCATARSPVRRARLPRALASRARSS